MKASFTYWQDGDFFLGFLDDFPDYQTQGESLDDLKEHLVDLYKELTSKSLPGVRQRGELIIA
jgi:hypothetical protein